VSVKRHVNCQRDIFFVIAMRTCRSNMSDIISYCDRCGESILYLYNFIITSEELSLSLYGDLRIIFRMLKVYKGYFLRFYISLLRSLYFCSAYGTSIKLENFLFFLNKMYPIDRFFYLKFLSIFLISVMKEILIL